MHFYRLKNFIEFVNFFLDFNNSSFNRAFLRIVSNQIVIESILLDFTSLDNIKNIYLPFLSMSGRYKVYLFTYLNAYLNILPKNKIYVILEFLS